MSPRIFDNVEMIRSALGEQIGPSAWITVDQDRVDLFADATSDHQWIHCDPERAASGPYGTTIAHGYLTLSLLPAFAAELYTIMVGSSRVNYGSNKVRYPAPVRVGSRIRATATIVECREESVGIFLTVRYVIEIEDGGKPALIAETVTLVLS